MSTIGIVDDNIEIRQGLKQILSLFDDLEVIYEGRDGQEAVDHVKNGKDCPDLFLMDVEMHHLDGLEATRIIKAYTPETKVLILSVTEGRSNLEKALANGADGYLVKGEKPLKMVQLIRDTLEGRMAMSPQMAGEAMQMLREGQKEKKEPESYGLTPREMDVLRELSAGKNHQQIAQELFIAPKTVRNHTENIYRKLNVHSRVEASRIAIENGWLIAD